MKWPGGLCDRLPGRLSGWCSSDHRPFHASCIVLSALLYVIAVTYLIIDESKNQGFRNSHLDDNHTVHVICGGWVEPVFSISLLLQGPWLVYGLSTLFREGDLGFLYFNPPHLSQWLFFTFALSMVSQIIWIILGSYGLGSAMFYVTAIYACQIFVCFYLSLRGLKRYCRNLIGMGNFRDVYLTIGLVQNGLALLATWIAILSLQMTIYLVPNNSEKGSTQINEAILYGILALFVIIYVVCDLLFMSRYFLFIFSPYAITLVILVGDIKWTWNPNRPTSIFVLILLVVLAIISLLKVTISIVKYQSDPTVLYPEEEDAERMPMIKTGSTLTVDSSASSTGERRKPSSLRISPSKQSSGTGDSSRSTTPQFGRSMTLSLERNLFESSEEVMTQVMSKRNRTLARRKKISLRRARNKHKSRSQGNLTEALGLMIRPEKQDSV